MKNSKYYLDKKQNEIEIWSEEVKNNTDYWKKVNGISYSLTKKEYQKIIKDERLN